MYLECKDIGWRDKQITIEECKEELTRVHEVLDNVIEKRQNDPSFLRGFLTFCERVHKYQNQHSKLSSAFHSFGSTNYSSKKNTGSSLLKKTNKKKIHVQPEAVKRRTHTSGSKASVAKGMRKRKNPFEKPEISKKRAHSFTQNVHDSEAVSKKPGRTMASKTRNKSSKETTFQGKKEKQ